jgi:SAM-dependent methyltransferase
VTPDDNHREAERVERIYSQRGYDTDPAYCDLNPTYLNRVQSMERATLRAIEVCGLALRLAELLVLDYGCGNGRWFGGWIAWGARPENLYGVDVRPSALEMAQTTFPQSAFTLLDNGAIQPANASKNIVFQNLVFSSILGEMRKLAATEIIRVLRPGGFVFLCDLTVNNPANPDVRALRVNDIRQLFGDLEPVYSKRVVLAPPLARRLVPGFRVAGSVLEASLPFLRTHMFVALRKPEVCCQ